MGILNIDFLCYHCFVIEITREKREKIKNMAEKYGLKLVLLFGSRVKGKVHEESDYDIAYLSDK
ncbi:nucleotidyltransferase domain-containing protein [Candidatus Parcubacteria bacterium]|nr:MAG: nucleotidyltransferase domain-containing protein [Candidatus Parcubacteria bacterium]